MNEDINRLDMICLVYLRLCVILFACYETMWFLICCILYLSECVILLPWFLLKFVDIQDLVHLCEWGYR